MNTPSKSHQFYTQTALKRNSPKRSPLCSYLWTSPILCMLLKTKSTNASEKCVLSMSNNHYIFLKCSVHAALYWKHRLCMQRKQSIPNYITFSCFGLRRFNHNQWQKWKFQGGQIKSTFLRSFFWLQQQTVLYSSSELLSLSSQLSSGILANKIYM